MNRTRIVATIGPITANSDSLRALAENGMNVARLNGSHNTMEWHAATIRLIRETLPMTPILFDIPGRKVRTGALLNEPRFAINDLITLTTEPGHDGSEKVSVNYRDLSRDLQPGHTILADDGTLKFTVVDVRGPDIICRAETPGTLRSHKGINVPHVKLNTPMVTERDHTLIGSVKELGVDYIGISFVESASHVEAIRTLAGANGPRIVSKIENQGGVDNMAEIIAATDIVMIDRGDLSVETNNESVGILQKQIITTARATGTPVIVATEMLHTMIQNDFPTKAEVSDITNAVLDGCGATMLSGETAIGAHPPVAVACMRRIATAAESFLQERLDGEHTVAAKSVPQAIESAIALICRTLPITKIVAITRSGFAARMIAAHQVRQPILAVSDDYQAARSFNLLPGVEGIAVDIAFERTSTDHIVECLKFLWQQGRITEEDIILVTAVGYPRSGNRMNLIQTHHVRDLREALNW